MRKKPQRMAGHSIEVIEDAPCLVFRSMDGSQMYFPAQGMQAVFEDAFRKFQAHEMQRKEKLGQYRPVMMFNPSSLETATTIDDKVAVVIDRNLPTEQTMTLSGAHARELGQALIATADQIAARPPTKAN